MQKIFQEVLRWVSRDNTILDTVTRPSEPGLPISIAFGFGVDPVFLYDTVFGSADHTRRGCVLELKTFFSCLARLSLSQ